MKLLVVSVTECVFLQLEQISELGEREMRLHVFFLIHHLGTESLFVRLPLENLFLDGSGLKFGLTLLLIRHT